MKYFIKNILDLLQIAKGETENIKIGFAVKWFLIFCIITFLGGIIARTINNQAIGLLFVAIFTYIGLRYLYKIKRKENSLKEINKLLNSNSFIKDELIIKGKIDKSSSLFNQIKIHNEKVLEHQKEFEKQRELEEEKQRKKWELEEENQRKKEEKRYNSLVKKYGEEMVEKSYNEEVFINQPKELLIIVMGEPEDIKKSVSKDKVRETFFYIPHQTHLKTTKYSYSVTLENDIVVKYKDLD